MRRVKDSLWATFGISKIKPFDKYYTKQQLRDWKMSENVQKVHKELYMPSNPKDLTSDIYLMIIIKSVFPFAKERT